MIPYTAATLSTLLYNADPMGTCCNGNEGMENEYDQIAATMLTLSETMSNEEAVKQAIIYWFDEYLYEYHKKELIQCLS